MKKMIFFATISIFEIVYMYNVVISKEDMSMELLQSNTLFESWNIAEQKLSIEKKKNTKILKTNNQKNHRKHFKPKSLLSPILFFKSPTILP